MKLIAHIRGPSKFDMDPAAYQRLSHELGQPNAHQLMAEISTTDHDYQRFLTILEDHGFSRWPGSCPRDDKTHYVLTIRRSYSEPDLDDAELLLALGGDPSFCYASKRDPAGQIVMPVEPGVTPNSAENAIVGSIVRWLFANESVCSTLEEARICGLTFEASRPVRLEDQDRAERDPSVPSYPGQVWSRLGSSIRLPPTAPSMGRVDCFTKEPVPRDYAKQMLLLDADDPAIQNAQLRYLRSELEPVAGFDVAEMSERFSAGHELIVSQRFRHVCIEHDINCRFEPIVIEDP